MLMSLIIICLEWSKLKLRIAIILHKLVIYGTDS